jgi:GAF domain-containing protein
MKKEVVGLLVVVRKVPQPFNPSNKTLLEAVADYASISLVNAGLFRALEERARSLQSTVESALAKEKRKDEIIQNIQKQITPPLKKATKDVDALLVGENARLNATQKGVLTSALKSLQEVTEFIEALHSGHRTPDTEPAESR